MCGKLLDIDLTSGKTSEIGIADETTRKYLGGRGLGARLLFDLLPAKTDPLSADNPLIFLTGPFTGSMAPGSSKFVVVTKSPLTNGWCDSYSSGRISLEIKKAGYDGLVIRGRSNHPCYLRLGDRGVEIREAGRLWGKALGKIDSVGVYKSVKSHRACQSCFVHCSLVTEAAEGKYKGATMEGPEYETLGMFGSNLLIDSLPTIIQANVLCDKLGLDTISAGNVIGFAMECFEKGLLTPGRPGQRAVRGRGKSPAYDR